MKHIEKFEDFKTRKEVNELDILTLTTFRCRSWTKRILITNHCMIRWIGFPLMRTKETNEKITQNPLIIPDRFSN